MSQTDIKANESHVLYTPLAWKLYNDMNHDEKKAFWCAMIRVRVFSIPIPREEVCVICPWALETYAPREAVDRWRSELIAYKETINMNHRLLTAWFNDGQEITDKWWKKGYVVYRGYLGCGCFYSIDCNLELLEGLCGIQESLAAKVLGEILAQTPLKNMKKLTHDMRHVLTRATRDTQKRVDYHKWWGCGHEEEDDDSDDFEWYRNHREEFSDYGESDEESA